MANKEKIVSQTMAAKIAGVTQGYLSRLRKKGNYKFFTSTGKINIADPEWIKFSDKETGTRRNGVQDKKDSSSILKKTNKSRSEEIADGFDKNFNLDKARFRKLDAEAFLKEMQNAKMAGILVDVSEIMTFFISYIDRSHHEVAQAFHKIAPRLMMIFQNEGLEKAVDFYRQEVSKIFKDIKTDQLKELENL